MMGAQAFRIKIASLEAEIARLTALLPEDPPRPAPVAPDIVEREVAWLIERKWPLDSIAGATEPRWYAENASGDHSWTRHPGEAKRFSTKAEAEAFPSYQMIAGDPAISITEHVWINDGFSWSHGRARATPRPEAPVAPDIVPVWDDHVKQMRKYAKEADRPVPAECIVTPQSYEFEEWAEALAALSSELAEAKRERDEWREAKRKLQADQYEQPWTISSAAFERRRAEAADAEVARLKDENKELVAGWTDTLASLVAATSLLSRSDKKAAPSDKMFDTMVADYEKAIERARRSLTAAKGG